MLLRGAPRRDSTFFASLLREVKSGTVGAGRVNGCVTGRLRDSRQGIPPTSRESSISVSVV